MPGSCWWECEDRAERQLLWAKNKEDGGSESEEELYLSELKGFLWKLQVQVLTSEPPFTYMALCGRSISLPPEPIYIP
jgi:hypothetical protein